MSRIERIQRFPFKVAPNPAAGANFTLTPRGVGIWRILSLAFVFTTSAVVASRAVTVEASNGAETFFRTVAGSVQAASIAGRYGAADGFSTQAAVGVTQLLAWPSGGVALWEGWSLTSVVDNIDAADQFTNVAAMVEELPSGRYLYVTPTESFNVEDWTDA